MPQLPPVASAVVTILGFALAITRLLTASRPFWSAFPAFVQKGAPVLMVALGVLPGALEHATSWLDVAEAFVVAISAWFVASRGDRRPPQDSDGGPRLQRSNTDPKVDDAARVPPLPNRIGRPPAFLILLLAGIALHQQACSSPPAKAPCDEATAAKMAAACSAKAYACGQSGKSEFECTAECDAQADARAAECQK